MKNLVMAHDLNTDLIYSEFVTSFCEFIIRGFPSFLDVGQPITI
jgi:hypothetical protein